MMGLMEINYVLKYYVMKDFQQRLVCFHNGLKVGFCFEYAILTDSAPREIKVYKGTHFPSNVQNEVGENCM